MHGGSVASRYRGDEKRPLAVIEASAERCRDEPSASGIAPRNKRIRISAVTKIYSRIIGPAEPLLAERTALTRVSGRARSSRRAAVKFKFIGAPRAYRRRVRRSAAKFKQYEMVSGRGDFRELAERHTKRRTER